MLLARGSSSPFLLRLTLLLTQEGFAIKVRQDYLQPHSQLRGEGGTLRLLVSSDWATCYKTRSDTPACAPRRFFLAQPARLKDKRTNDLLVDALRDVLLWEPQGILIDFLLFWRH